MTNLRLHSSGVFSNVYRGTLREPGPQKEIALKKTWPEKADPNDPRHINLELIMLLALSRDPHKNIVQVLFTFQSISDRKDKKICESMVFDFMPQTLSATIPQVFGPPLNTIDIKLYTWQLFNGLYYLLKKRICHRDIKPQNLLVDPVSGCLKIGDFGSAKHMGDSPKSSPYQVTRFYRPPELLLESDQYSCLVDVWSAGCCVGEMIRGEVLFPGRDSKHQLRLIMQSLGSPTEADIIAMKAPTRLEGPQVVPRGLEMLVPKAPKEFVSFLQRILVYNPRNRLCGRELLLDQFFADIFAPTKRRNNGRMVGDAISFEDIQELRNPRRRSRKHSQNSVATATLAVAEDVPNRQNGETKLSKETVTAIEETNPRPKKKTSTAGRRIHGILQRRTSKESVKTSNSREGGKPSNRVVETNEMVNQKAD
uniref:Protein kinase domain-containing protein n=1 Tax=Panagrolaimus sp. JU765 TaxID=591449 RepID=A0AC34QUM0_9BILA